MTFCSRYSPPKKASGARRNVEIQSLAGEHGVAASANFPLLLLSPCWQRFNTIGAIAGLTTGLLASIGLILAGPTVTGIDSPENNHHLIHARPWYPLEKPGIPSVPLSFRSCGRRHPAERTIRSEEKSHELQVRAKIGPWTPRERSWIDAGIPPAVTALLTVVGRIDGLIHAHALLRALADIYAD